MALAEKVVIMSNHRLPHVHKPAQVAENRRAPSPVHAQVIDQERLKPNFFVENLS